MAVALEREISEKSTRKVSAGGWARFAGCGAEGGGGELDASSKKLKDIAGTWVHRGRGTLPGTRATNGRRTTRGKQACHVVARANEGDSL